MCFITFVTPFWHSDFDYGLLCLPDLEIKLRRVWPVDRECLLLLATSSYLWFVQGSVIAQSSGFVFHTDLWDISLFVIVPFHRRVWIDRESNEEMQNKTKTIDCFKTDLTSINVSISVKDKLFNDWIYFLFGDKLKVSIRGKKLREAASMCVAHNAKFPSLLFFRMDTPSTNKTNKFIPYEVRRMAR
jgi:hypothetical protein